MADTTGKNHKLYYSIGEVAEMFGVTESTLRFWEKKFPSIEPRKGGRNIRQYSQENIDEIRVVYNLTKVRGMKLSTAKQVLTKSHDKAVGKTDVLTRLQAIRDELVGLRKELESL